MPSPETGRPGQLPNGSFMSLHAIHHCVAVCGVWAVLATGCRPAPRRPAEPELLAPGRELPPLVATGWLNGPSPRVESLRGHVVVICSWASWCEPCRRAVPEYVRLFQQYRDRGVIFIGLTAEGPSELEEIRAHLAHQKIEWTNGYGAGDAIQALGAVSVPSSLVVGPAGRVVWNSSQAGSLADAIETALSQSADPGDQPVVRPHAGPSRVRLRKLATLNSIGFIPVIDPVDAGKGLDQQPTARHAQQCGRRDLWFATRRGTEEPAQFTFAWSPKRTKLAARRETGFKATGGCDAN